MKEKLMFHIGIKHIEWHIIPYQPVLTPAILILAWKPSFRHGLPESSAMDGIGSAA
jgi:hypothetical protein